MDHLQDRWLSNKEICAFLEVSDDPVYCWIKYHDIPTPNMGRLWKFKINVIDEWIKAGGANHKQQKDDSK